MTNKFNCSSKTKFDLYIQHGYIMNAHQTVQISALTQQSTNITKHYTNGNHLLELIKYDAYNENLSSVPDSKVPPVVLIESHPLSKNTTVHVITEIFTGVF